MCIISEKRLKSKKSKNNITERIRVALDNNQPVSGVFVDLQKAFDTDTP